MWSEQAFGDNAADYGCGFLRQPQSVITRNERAGIDDRWPKRVKDPNGKMRTERSAVYGKVSRWRVRWVDSTGSERTKSFRISIGPGVVRLGWTNPVRAEKTAERAVSHHQRDVDDAKLKVRNDLELTDGDDDQAVVSSTRRSPTEDDRRGTGGVITQWSRKSRSAICRTFAELDYTPLVESGRVPAMVTLTYPGDWEIVAPDGASVKRHMVLWRERFQREYGEPARYIWKLEFQRRGAPHIHMWMAPATSPGRSGLGFAQWLSETWARVVDHPDPEQRARHRLAGTAVDVRNGLKACDPKRLAIYFTKHSSPNMQGDKEYQHIVPELWQQPGRGPGRFWGVYGLKKAIAIVEVAQDAYIAARRSSGDGPVARRCTEIPPAAFPQPSSRGRQFAWYRVSTVPQGL